MKSLKKLRQQIDKLDNQLLEILARRFAVTKQVGEYKKKKNLPVQDKKREKEIFRERRIWAKRLNLNPLFIEKLFKLIIKNVKENHRKIKK